MFFHIHKTKLYILNLKRKKSELFLNPIFKIFYIKLFFISLKKIDKFLYYVLFLIFFIILENNYKYLQLKGKHSAR